MSSSLEMPDMKSSSEDIGVAVVSGVGGPSFRAEEAILLLNLWAVFTGDSALSAAFRFLD